MNSLPITVVIPVLNEELNLPACFEALGDVFERIVVVDSGSTDRTCEIARSGGADVLQFMWDGTFPKKRNWALRTIEFSTPWVLFVDADERVTPEFIEELHRMLSDTVHAGFWISFTNWFMGCPLHHGDVFRKLALFRVGAGEYEKFPENGWSSLDMEVHEHPVLTGSIGEIRSRIEHNDFRTVEHYLQKHDEYASWEANRFFWLKTTGEEEWSRLTRRQRLKYGLLDSVVLGPLYFLGSYVWKRGFLDGRSGFQLACCKWRYFSTIRRKIRQKM